MKFIFMYNYIIFVSLSIGLFADTKGFGVPDYDSDWTEIPANAIKTFSHNINGDSGNYVVDMQQMDDFKIKKKRVFPLITT